jgi:hypothetical protein
VIQLPFVPLELPSDFASLPGEERSRILTAGHAMTKYAYRRAAAIMIGAPAWRGTAIRSGSALVVEQDGAHFLGTAWHVIAYWLKIRRRVKDLVFQVADALIDPAQALVWKDESADIAFLSLTPEQFAQIPIAVCEATKGWPPPRPEPGQYVVMSGYPSVIRQQLGPRTIQFNALSSMLQVTAVGSDYAVCQFFRENWVSFDEHGVPAPGTHLDGISGAPVLQVRRLDYPLIGVVSEFSRDFELLYFKLLADVPPKFQVAHAV